MMSASLISLWPRNLALDFGMAGMQQIETHTVLAKLHHEFAMHQCNLLIYETIAQQPRNASNGQTQEIAQLVQRASYESKKGVVFAFPRLTAVARKPLAP